MPPGPRPVRARPLRRQATPTREALLSSCACSPPQHVACEALALRQFLELGIDESGIDPEALLAAFYRLERNFLKQLLHDCLQPPGADILALLVDRPGDLGQ